MTEYQQLDAKLDQVLQRISTIEAVVQRQGELCPHRELLARAANNIIRMEKMEGRMTTIGNTITDVRLEVARIGAIAGGISGLGGAVVTAVVMKALGL